MGLQALQFLVYGVLKDFVGAGVQVMKAQDQLGGFKLGAVDPGADGYFFILPPAGPIPVTVNNAPADKGPG